MQIQNSQEVRHEVARSIFHAKTLLVFLHTGQQDFTGQFKERRIKVAQQRHGTLNQSLNFIKQAIDPDDFAIGRFRDSVPFADDIGAPFSRLQLNGPFLHDGGNVIARGLDREGTGTKHAVPLRNPPGSHFTDFKRNDNVAKQRKNPPDGTGKSKLPVSPPHTLGKGQSSDNRRAQASQHVQCRHAAGFLHP